MKFARHFWRRLIVLIQEKTMKNTRAVLACTACIILIAPHSVLAQPVVGRAATIEPGTTQCKNLADIPTAVLDAPFIVFGEVHGTREVPGFVFRYLCTAAKMGKGLTLAVEYPSSQQNALDAFLSSNGTVQDIKSFIGSRFWSNERQDGRTSVDMLRMYENIRRLRLSGSDINVVAIDDEVPVERRDIVMAENLRTALHKGNGNGRQVVALIGGLHATRTKGNRFNSQYESTIYLLAAEKPLTLTVGTSGGTAWVCRGGTSASCLATTWDINRVTPALPTPFSLSPPSPQFDGVFFVGATSASSPAVKNAVPERLFEDQ
jgi:hypothetical protein